MKCLFQKGGVNISKKIHFTLILALILFLSINVISAYEINDNNSDSISLDSSNNTVFINSAENVNDLSADSNNQFDNVLSNDSKERNTEDSGDIEENLNVKKSNNLKSSSESNENLKSDSPNQNLNNSLGSKSLIKTNVSVKSTDILRGTDLYVFLKDANGNPIANKTLTLTFNNRKYSKVTDANGRVSLLIKSAKAAKYNLTVDFPGDSNHHPANHSFIINVYQIETHITVNSRTIIRGSFLYAYLRNGTNQVIAGQNLTISFRGATYKKTTDSNGRVSLRINSAPAGKYSFKINYAGTYSYLPSSRSFTLTVAKQSTSVSVNSTSIVKGNFIYAYLKNSTGGALASQSIIMRFNNRNYYKTTNANGMACLKINSGPGSFPAKIIYEGSGYYLPSSYSFTAKTYLDTPKIVVENSTVIRSKCLYAYLKDSSDKALSDQKIIITFGSRNYTRTTNSLGKIGLQIVASPNNYSVKISYAGSASYKAVSKSLTVNVLTNATAKIIAKSQTSLGEYSIRLTDMDGNPIADQYLNITASTFNHTAGSGKNITAKTIIIDTDYIYSDAKDKQYMKDLAAALKAKGYNVIVSGRGPNEHCNDVMGDYSNACVLCLFGGADSGMFVDMSAKWYQNYLNKYNLRVVLGFTLPPNTVDLATISWLKRAHDDDYSPSNFTGLAYPGTYLNQHGMDYIYGRSVTEMANNFVKYAVNGLSIGLNNTLPSVVTTYSLKTNDNGYVTLSGLSSGNYTVEISYSNATLGYAADTVTAKVEIK